MIQSLWDCLATLLSRGGRPDPHFPEKMQISRSNEPITNREALGAWSHDAFLDVGDWRLVVRAGLTPCPPSLTRLPARDYFTCAGAVKSRLRRVRSTSWLIQIIARTIPSRTAASTNHGQV